MLHRKACSELVSWKNRKHDCLMVEGFRHVGKTYTIRQFAKDNYDDCIEFDFLEDGRLCSAFDGDLDPDTILGNLSRMHDGIEFVPGRTLIVFDDIQECPRARSSLKFFSEDGRYDVIGSGRYPMMSLPGKRYDNALTPMGYEEQIAMSPLNFEEFLWAMGIGPETIDGIRTCISERRAMEEGLLELVSSMFDDFIEVGGMPEAVQAYADSRNREKAVKILDPVRDLIETDMGRYGYCQSDGDGQRWTVCAGYGLRCMDIDRPGLPLKSREKPGSFKVCPYDSALFPTITDDPIGMKVAGCLVGLGFVPRRYPVDGDNSDIEPVFVVELGTQLSVIEVKSGKDREYPSLSKVSEYFDVDRRIVLERDNIHVSEDGVEHYPLFTAAFVDSMVEPWDGPEF